MSVVIVGDTPSVPATPALRFPLATVGQVRREVARQLGTIPRARRWFLLSVVLLGLGSYASVQGAAVDGADRRPGHE